MAPLAGALAIHQQLAEGAIAQHLAEGGEVFVVLIDVEVDLQFACRRGQDCCVTLVVVVAGLSARPASAAA
jgi:hypothetical protein